MLLLYALVSATLYANLLLEKSGFPERHLLEAERAGIILLALAGFIAGSLSPTLLVLATVSSALRLLYVFLPSREELHRFAAPPALWLHHLAAAALGAALFGYAAAELVAGISLLLGILLEVAARRPPTGGSRHREESRREGEVPVTKDLRAAKGLLFSALIYYGIPFRLLRLRRFYSDFVGKGSLVFDVGAHIGNRVRAFRSLGARVIAMEPQRSCTAILNRFYGSDREVTILPEAVGESVGEGELFVSPENPTMSTLSSGWIDAIHEHYPEQGIEWDRRERVIVTTLDRLVEAYGEPDFVKIDVEGFEDVVLRGASRPLKALSFEFLPAAVDGAVRCIEILEALGAYRYNYSVGERMRLSLDRWVDGATMRSLLSEREPGQPSGDVYAVFGGSRSKTR